MARLSSYDADSSQLACRLGRLKACCKPRDFVLAPVIRDGDLNLDTQADKPILITGFTKDSEEWGNDVLQHSY
jgi:hypothetical protein